MKKRFKNGEIVTLGKVKQFIKIHNENVPVLPMSGTERLACSIINMPINIENKTYNSQIYVNDKIFEIIFNETIRDYIIYHEVGHISLYNKLKNELDIYESLHEKNVMESLCDIYAFNIIGPDLYKMNEIFLYMEYMNIDDKRTVLPIYFIKNRINQETALFDYLDGKNTELNKLLNI